MFIITRKKSWIRISKKNKRDSIEKQSNIAYKGGILKFKVGDT